jgi:hypothetical protein
VDVDELTDEQLDALKAGAKRYLERPLRNGFTTRQSRAVLVLVAEVRRLTEGYAKLDAARDQWDAEVSGFARKLVEAEGAHDEDARRLRAELDKATRSLRGLLIDDRPLTRTEQEYARALVPPE